MDFHYDVTARSVVRGQSLRIQFASSVPFASTHFVCLLGFSVARDEEGPVLFEEDSSVWFRHQPVEVGDLLRVKEFCCGIGGLGVGASKAGFQIAACNDIRQATMQALKSASSATQVLGCIASDSTVAALWHASPGPCCASSGFSCQPFSNLGDKKGAFDSRAVTLPASLRAAWMLQARVIVLECVAPAARHAFVRGQLESFKRATGFLSHEILLDLAQVWVSARLRWWCVLYAPDIQPIQLRPWKADDQWPTVDAVLNRFQVSFSQLMQLRLHEDEAAEFAARKPLRSYALRTNAKAPTALHSWGNPTTGCPCGCRSQSFSPARLDSGICAVLVPLPDLHFRHLAAAEAALLNGLSPARPTGASERLGLALVGQLASPLQAAWVFAFVAKQLGVSGFIEVRQQEPEQLLHKMRQDLFEEAVNLGMFRQMKPEAADTDIDEPSPKHATSQAIAPGAQLTFSCPCSCLAGALMDRFFVETGTVITQLAVQGRLVPRGDLLRQGQEVTVLAKLQAPALLAPCAIPAQFCRLLAPSMSGALRKQLLHCQNGWLADDQVLAALFKIATHQQQVYVLDPALAAMALQFRDKSWMLCDLPQEPE